MKPYDVLVTHVGRWWLIEVAELEASTQSPRFAEVEHRARRLIADTLDVPVSAVRLGSFELELGGLSGDAISEGVAAVSFPHQREAVAPQFS